jgi:hypothetical protein
MEEFVIEVLIGPVRIREAKWFPKERKRPVATYHALFDDLVNSAA